MTYIEGPGVIGPLPIVLLEDVEGSTSVTVNGVTMLIEEQDI
jgi:hypothetical protein